MVEPTVFLLKAPRRPRWAQRGRLGAFSKNTVGSTIKNLGVSLENTAAAESAIRDTDYAFETAELTRLQIMNQAATQA